ncbi:cytosolic protein [Radiobacillus sp. PE A8.2]|uniref:cytosolic protein n=1 Tax=Radiobacillus sp. PE A8.2 TaxID=3380349 RepID=UPI0038905F0C
MFNEDEEKYSDFSNVEAGRNYLIPEQLPEGPYGSPINKDKPVQNKSTPWKEGQRYYSAFNFPDKDQHQDLPRQEDGAHPIHDHDGDVEPNEEDK